MANSNEDASNIPTPNPNATPTYICRVGVKVRVRVKGVKRIPIGARRDRYAKEEIFTSANMTMMELDK